MVDEKNKKEIDQHSGVETTGHEWDGLKELNTPMPRWWLWTFLVCVIWAFGYWVVYPAWPTLTGHTEGSKKWTEYKQLKIAQKEIFARKKKYISRIKKASLEKIRTSQDLFDFSKQAGEILFKNNCSTCHQAGGAGAKSYPNLNDDDWLWGGTLEEIQTTITHGIRAKDDETHDSLMPAFGKDGILQKAEIEKIVQYLLSLSGKNDIKNQKLIAEGKELFANNCASCHGKDAKGGKEFGAPNLADAIWLKATNADEIEAFVYNAKMGAMPNWGKRLSETEIKMLTIYVHSLGGGK
jgi:cytochrome c oxidase cbb3-type subunit 3